MVVEKVLAGLVFKYQTRPHTADRFDHLQAKNSWKRQQARLRPKGPTALPAKLQLVFNPQEVAEPEVPELRRDR